jgi:hypothetical protein
MKRILKKSLPLVLIAALLSLGGVAVSCKSSKSRANSGEVMYPRKSSKSQKVKSNIKVKGNNKANGHTTRSY